jgi:phospholipid-binding lipoprotein MlaA
MISARRRAVAGAVLIALALAVSGCATTGKSPGQRLDPWENWNRKVFGFNEALDENVLKPVATAYKNVVPQFVRSSIGNVFGNIGDAWSAVNNVLQLKFEPALRDTVRFTTNSIFGFGGILDIATEMGIDHQYEDFGQTLGHWGVGAGAYIVWPVLGPSTVRESFAMPLDRLATPALVFADGNSKTGITLLQMVNTRADFLGASRLLNEIALDRYSFVRDAYLARRRSLVYDGDPPETPAPSDGPASAPAASGAPAAPPAAPPSAPVTTPPSAPVPVPATPPSAPVPVPTPPASAPAH